MELKIQYRKWSSQRTHRMTHGHERWCGDCLREWGAGWRGLRGKPGTTVKPYSIKYKEEIILSRILGIHKYPDNLQGKIKLLGFQFYKITRYAVSRQI